MVACSEFVVIGVGLLQGLNNAVLCNQSYRLTKMASGDVGCAANSAQRISEGGVPGMAALVDVAPRIERRRFVTSCRRCGS